MNFGSLRLHFFLLNIIVLSFFLILIHRTATPSQEIAHQQISPIFKNKPTSSQPTGTTEKPKTENYRRFKTYTKLTFPSTPGAAVTTQTPVLNFVAWPPQYVAAVLNRLKKTIVNAWNYNDSNNDVQLLSRRMNLMLMELNKLMCELYDKETTTGAWCVYDFKTGHVTDLPLATALSYMFENYTVASFGDGPGQYKRIIQERGLVKSYDAFDGSPMIEQLTDGNVTFLDLSMPQYGLPLYDWVMSLEVIEHIPSQFEDIVLGNLVRHAKIGLILSWPQPGQGGLGHVNEKLDAYVIEKLRALCFERELEWSNYLRDLAKLGWLKSNLYVYYRGENCTADPALA